VKPPDLPDAVVELLLRYELGEFSPRVRARLASIFQEDPPDAIERLQKAADYLGLTGEGLPLVAAAVDALNASDAPASRKEG